MKIYEFPGFPNPARVSIALAEKGLTDKVMFVTIDVPGGAHKKPGVPGEDSHRAPCPSSSSTMARRSPSARQSRSTWTISPVSRR